MRPGAARTAPRADHESEPEPELLILPRERYENRKQEEVIVALLSPRNVEEAARVTKIGTRTI